MSRGRRFFYTGCQSWVFRPLVCFERQRIIFIQYCVPPIRHRPPLNVCLFLLCVESVDPSELLAALTLQDGGSRNRTRPASRRDGKMHANGGMHDTGELGLSHEEPLDLRERQAFHRKIGKLDAECTELENETFEMEDIVEVSTSHIEIAQLRVCNGAGGGGSCVPRGVVQKLFAENKQSFARNDKVLGLFAVKMDGTFCRHELHVTVPVERVPG